MSQKLIWLFVLAGLLGAAGGWMFSRVMAPAPASPPPVFAASPQDLVGQRRPGFRLGNIRGDWVSASDFDGQVVLINFWATWCAPCRAEMPMLNRLQEEFAERGLQVVGVALDDVGQAREFVEELGIHYPVLVGLADVMETGRRYGNTAGLLPYSVLVDRAGVVRWVELGELSKDELLHRIEAML